MEIDLSRLYKPISSLITRFAVPMLTLGVALGATVTANALPASAFATNSKLAQGHWVKVEVDTTGVYAISYNQLRQWGFDNPESVGVYGTGAVTAAVHDFSAAGPDDLPPVTVMHDGDRVIFYAEGSFRVTPISDIKATFERNLYDSHSYYFLSDCGNPRTTMPEVAYDGNPDNRDEMDRSWAISVVEPEEHNPGLGGAQLFSRPIAPGSERSFVLDMSDMTYRRNGGARVGYVGIGYIANLTTDGSYSPEVSISNPWVLTAPNFSAVKKHTSTTNYNFYQGSLNFSCDDNLPQRLTVSYKVPGNYSGDFWCVDYVYGIYTRLNRLGNNAWRELNLSNVSVGTPLAIQEATREQQVWDVSEPANPCRLLPEYREDGSAVVTIRRSYAADIPTKILIFNPKSTFPAPVFAGEVSNQNLHADTDIPDMLIVTTSSLEQYARELADIHGRTRNLKVSVVCQDDIFNEFSSGSRCPQGIRRYIKMLHDRDTAGRFRYVLLYGGSSADNRFVEHAPQDLLVCMEAENDVEVSSNSTNYCADVYFGMVDDNCKVSEIYIQHQQLSVGRLPVRTPEQALGVNAKILRYITHPTSPATAMRACFVSDLDPNANKDEHLMHNDSARALISRARPDMVFETIDLIRYSGAEYTAKTIGKSARQRFIQSLRDGCNLVWYSGHGGHNSFSLTELMKSPHMADLNNTEYPWGVFSTCRLNDFDYETGSLLEAAVLNPNGGFIGATGSGREVFLIFNEKLNVQMANTVAQASPNTTLADIFRDARNAIIPEEISSTIIGRGRNATCYNFIGDPSLPIHFSSANVDILSVEGQTPGANAVPTASTGVSTAITAKVAGASASNFNGHGQLRVFAPRDYTTMLPDSVHQNYKNTTWLGNKTHTFVGENNLLAEYPVEVTAGTVNATVVLPVAVADSARLYIYVRDDASGTIASGHTYINLRKGTSTTPTEGAPVFEGAYIDTPDFVNGDIVKRPTNVIATVRAGQTGVVTAVAGAAQRPECILDGTMNITSSLSCFYNGDGLLELKGALPELTDGAHHIVLTVSDFAGNAVSHTLDFVVDSQPLTATLAADGPVVRTGVEITIDDVPVNAEVTALTVSDASGNTVRTFANPTFPLQWNLTDASGRTVADGEYKVHARLRRGNSYGSTPYVRFTVIGR